MTGLLRGGGWAKEGRRERTFPWTSMAPPITMTSLARRNVSGSTDAARAKFVKGPIATRDMVSASFSRSIRRIS